jgi:hypothetical protein
MGGSRHPGRLKILEILKHNSSNLPSKVRQPISIVLNLRGILQVPTSEQYRLRNTSRRSRTLQLSCNHSPRTRRHQDSTRRVVQTFSSFTIKYSTSTPQRPSPPTTSTRQGFLAYAETRKKSSSTQTQKVSFNHLPYALRQSKHFAEDIGARRRGTSPTARRTLQSCSAQSNFITARRTEQNKTEPARFSTTNPPDGNSGKGRLGQSFRQSPNRSEQADDSAVGSLPTSETGSGRFSRVAELGALLPASLDSEHFVVANKDATVQLMDAHSASMMLPCIAPTD